MTRRRDPAYPTRRRLVTGLVAGAASLAATRAFAQAQDDPLQQLMRQNERGSDFGHSYDSTSRTIHMPKASLPTLSPGTAQTTAPSLYGVAAVSNGLVGQAGSTSGAINDAVAAAG